jgi:DNA-binding MarR family transcriptional regulator
MTDPFDLTHDPVGRRVTIGLAKIGLATRSRAWQEAGVAGLTPTQGQILALLRARPARAMRLTALAQGLAVTLATTSDAVRALTAKGLVRKDRSPADGRAIAISLTEAGKREADRVVGWSDFLLDAVDALTPDEQAVFLRGLIKMIRALQLRGEIPVSRMCVTCRFFRPHAHPDRHRPHHCAFVDAPFGDRQLRLDCPDHDDAGAAVEHVWQAFVAVGE